MAESLKKEVSLTVLKIRLLDANASSAPASGADSTSNQTLTPNQRIVCELQVTGDAQERGLVVPATQAANYAPSRRKRTSSRPTYEGSEGDTLSSPSRTLAQWSFAPEEMQLPVHYNAAAQFSDKPNVAGGWLADLARFAVFKLLNEIRADTLERFASATNWLPSGKPTLPATMIRQLQTLLPSIMRKNDSLWLELAEPAGYLPLLPWEEMLRPVTSVPILRLSPHALKALSPERGLSVMLCVTAPSDKWTPTGEQLTSLASAIRESLPERSTLHVFADDLCHAPFVLAKNKLRNDDSRGRIIKLYDLPHKKFVKENRDDPWRAWIVESLDGRAADIVHFVAPGLLFADHSRLVIPREPLPSERLTKSTRKPAHAEGRPLRYLTPLELSESLTLIGAWGAIFSTPSRGSWLVQARMGLRLFVDQIARLRPAVAVFHDFEADPRCEALAETYEFMIGDPSIMATQSPSVSVYCHPARATAVVAEPSSIPGELLQQYRRVKEVMQAAIARGDPLPSWMAATQRIVEQAVSRAEVDEAKGVDNAAIRGLGSALLYVEQMLADQVHAGASESTSARIQQGEKTSG